MFLISLDIPPTFQDEVCHIAESRLSKMGSSSNQNKPSDRRNQGIRSESLRVGAAIGGEIMWQQLMDELKKKEYQLALDRIFNFSYLRYDWNMLPPIIESAEQSVELHGHGRLMTTDRIFKIIEPAKLITATPTWRAYFKHYDFTDTTATQSLLPANASETRVWREGLCDGAKQGVIFAADQFADALSRLTRDYKGMLLYKQLEVQGMVKPPKLSSKRHGTQQNHDTLVINKTEYIITDHSRFLKPSDWEAPQISFDYAVSDNTPPHIRNPKVIEDKPNIDELTDAKPITYQGGQILNEDNDKTIIEKETVAQSNEQAKTAQFVGTPASQVFNGFLGSDDGK